MAAKKKVAKKAPAPKPAKAPEAKAPEKGPETPNVYRADMGESLPNPSSK